VSSPIDDVLAVENDPDTELSLAAAFADVDIGDSLTLSVSGNTNPGLVTADLIGTQLTLSYLPDQSGTAEITVRATESTGPGLWVEDTFTVTVNPDNFAPIVANPIFDITVDAGGGDTVMYLSEVFADNFGVEPALDYTAIEIDPVTGAPSADTGLFQYKFTLYGHDGADASFATTSLTFSGNIQQSTFNWNNVDYPAHEEGTADIFHSPPAFNRHLDTWRYNGWTSIAPGDSNLPPAGFFDPGPQDGEDVIISAGSGSAVFYEQKDVVQIVALGDVTWSGEFARQQVSYNTSGTADGNRLTLSVEGNTNPGLVTASMLGSQLTLAYEPGAGGEADITVRATDPEGAWVEETFTVTVNLRAEVVGRHIFYNNSALDAGGDDDAAIDPVKTPLLPQGTASSDNYTSYSRGINGIMVDIDGLPGTPTVGDIGVRVNQAAAPDTWSAGPAPESVTVRPGEGVGGSDRVTIVWADGAILNQWVEVSVLSGANTGLGAADVFYAGNVVGDSNDDGRIDAGDLTALISEFGMRGGAELLADVNIDGRVNLTDSAIMRSNFGTSLGLPTMPPADYPGQTVRFVVIGDYGFGSADEADVADMVTGLDPDFIVTTGDNRYGFTTFDEVVGQYYCPFLTDAGSGPYCSGGDSPTNAFFPSLGNHDYLDGGGVDEYLDYFTLPGTGVDSTYTSGSERYYDFIQGPVHFFVLDSDMALFDPVDMTAQQDWLQAQLATSTTPWQIVYMHHPPYSSGWHGSSIDMQWPYAAWGADFVMSGHDHTYERIEADGIVYFVNGLGGSSSYGFNIPISGSEVRYRDDFGAMLVEASPGAVNFRFINRGGMVIDDYTYNEQPAGSVVASAMVAEDDPAGTAVGTFSAVHPAAAPEPVVDLLAEFPSAGGYISGPQPISTGSSATMPYREATGEYDLLPPGEDNPTDGEADLLADILAESALAVPL
jgi:hypothetical protein